MEFYILWFHSGGTSLYFYNIQLYVSSHMSGQEVPCPFYKHLRENAGGLKR